MFSIIKRTLLDRKTIIIVYCIGVLGFVLLYTNLFPTIKEQSKSISTIFNGTSKTFQETFHLQNQSFFTLEGFLSTEYLSFLWPILSILFTVSFAGSAISGEIERGIIGLSLSEPISRSRIFVSKYLAGLVQQIVFLIFSILSISLTAALAKLSFSFNNLITLFILCTIFLICILSLSFFVSSLFSERGKVYLSIGGLLVIMYVLNIISTLNDNLDKLKYLSFFYYYDPQKAFVENKIDNTAFIVFILVGILTFILGITYFNKRDIQV